MWGVFLSGGAADPLKYPSDGVSVSNAVFRGSFWPDRAIILVCVPAVLLMFYTHLKFYRGETFFHTSLNSLTSVAYRFSWNRDFLWAAFNHVLQLSTWSGRQSTLKQGQTVVF